MSKYKFLISLSIILLGIIFSLIFVNVSYLQTSFNNESEIGTKELCSSVTSGLKFCTDTSKISINSNEIIILNFSVTNISDKEIRVKTNRDISKFIIKVTNEYGETMLSKLEQKRRYNTMTHDDFVDLINSSFRDHRSEVLKPNQKLDEKLNIGYIYDFTNAGKYYVEIARHTMNPNGEGYIEISLGKIEIEVK